jgi:lysophospholipase L1-like esterase
MNSANELIQRYCAAHENLKFVDINSGLFDSNGESRLNFFQNDQLHFNEAGYRQIASVIKPVVASVYNGK